MVTDPNFQAWIANYPRVYRIGEHEFANDSNAIGYLLVWGGLTTLSFASISSILICGPVVNRLIPFRDKPWHRLLPPVRGRRSRRTNIINRYYLFDWSLSRTQRTGSLRKMPILYPWMFEIVIFIRLQEWFKWKNVNSRNLTDDLLFISKNVYFCFLFIYSSTWVFEGHVDFYLLQKI